MALLVERIRASENYIPELAVVAVDDSGVLAHTMLSWVGLENSSRERILNLSPMSVRPDRQRQGVGSQLIGAVLERAEAAGEPAVMVEGIPEYYPRFGFERASTLGFVAPSDVDSRRGLHGQAASGLRPEPRRTPSCIRPRSTTSRTRAQASAIGRPTTSASRSSSSSSR